MRYFSVVSKIALALLFTVSYVLAQEPTTVMVRGDVFKPREWSISDIKQQFSNEIQTIKLPAGKDGQQQSATGVPLISLIKAAELKVEKTPKHYDLTFLVYIQAHDSYRVFFSLAELMPQGGSQQAWLVWEVDGKPLSGKEAPYRLVALGEGAHDRQIYGVTSINLVDGTKLANRLNAGQ
jgi:DMSO/TMAO reductase YedYZ molybdopterin-dependent catalytic subunit